MSLTFSSPLERAILETLVYSDVFDFPLTLDELHRYLTYPATKEEVLNCLNTLPAVSSSSNYYYLSHRAALVDIRLERDSASRPVFRRALFYGRILGLFPFVRMVAMTGSLAVLNLSTDVDMDYMLVTQPGRLWLARAFAVTFGRFMRWFGDRICVNLLVSESALEWAAHDLYSARETCQMIPIAGREAYLRLRQANLWTETFLPNAVSEPEQTPGIKPSAPRFQRLLEFPLRGRFGNFLESWAEDFQMKKILHTYGSGSEANFSADLCQGNFRNHHAWTDRSFQEHLAALDEGRGRS